MLSQVRGGFFWWLDTASSQIRCFFFLPFWVGGVRIIKVSLNHIVITGLENRPCRGMGGAESTLIFFLSSLIKIPMKEIMMTTRLICFEYSSHVLICTSPSALVPLTFVLLSFCTLGELKYYRAFDSQSYVDLQCWSFLVSF